MPNLFDLGVKFEFSNVKDRRSPDNDSRLVSVNAD